MVENYVRWSEQIDRAARIDPALAQEIDTAAMSRDYGTLRVKLDALRQLPDGRSPASRLRKMTHYDWRIRAHKDPILALRSDYSISGFNPGSPEAASYVIGRLQNKNLLGQAKALGEITLQKELVAIMLRGDATLLPHKAIPVFKEFVDAVAAYKATPNETSFLVLKAKLEAFKGDSANSYVQAVVGKFHRTFEKYEKMAGKQEGLLATWTKAVNEDQNKRPGLEAQRTALTSDINAWQADISTKKGEIGRLEGDNRARERVIKTDIDFIKLNRHDPALAGAILQRQGDISANQSAIALNNTRISTARGDITSLQSNIDRAGAATSQIGRDLQTLSTNVTVSRAAADSHSARLIGQGALIDKHLGAFNGEVNKKIGHFKDLLRVADEYGLAVVLHCDWGEPAIRTDQRPREATSDYRYFDELLGLTQQFPGARIILAHTGFGRLTKPDATVVPFTHAQTSPLVAKRGTTEHLPVHIARLYKAKELAPNVRFDISWNDVGERYVNEPGLLKHIADFIVDYPDAVVFGTDTVKPVNKAQYQQAFHSLYPLYMQLARRTDAQGNNIGRPLLWKLLRGNLETVLGDAQQGVKTKLNADLAGTSPPQRLNSMNKTIDRIEAGQTKLAGLAEQQFYQHLDYFLQTHTGPTRTEQAPSYIVPSWDDVPAQSIANALLPHGENRPEPRDTSGKFRRTIAQRGTATGAAGSRQVQVAAAVQTGERAVFAGGLTAMGMLAESVLSSGVTNLAFASDSVARQTLFFTKLTYREYVRWSWESMFEEGKVTSRSVDVFFNRVVNGAKAAGFNEARLPEVAAVTAQFKADLDYIENVSANWNRLFPNLSPQKSAELKARWESKGKQQAIMATVGFYQIRVDRALGAQAASLDLFNPSGKIGRRINDVLLGTTGVSLGAEIADFINLMPHKTYPWLWDVQVQQMPAQLRAFFQDWGGFERGENYLDIAALALMGGRLMAENAGGKRNTNDIDRLPGIRRLQTAVLGALAARGAVGATHHGIKAYEIRQQGGLPVGELSKATAEAMVFYYGMRSGYFEARRQQGTHAGDPAQIARANQLLVAALAARASMG